jgi:ATP-dependent DNA ligase
LRTPQLGIVLNEHYEGDGEIIFKHACKLGCEGTVSKRLGSLYRSGRSRHWLKIKNPKAPAVKREAEVGFSGLDNGQRRKAPTVKRRHAVTSRIEFARRNTNLRGEILNVVR